MNTYKLVAIALIAAGILGLVYTHFSYTKDTHETILGPLAVTVKEKKTVNIPTTAGVVSVIAGTAMLIFAQKKGALK